MYISGNTCYVFSPVNQFRAVPSLQAVAWATVLVPEVHAVGSIQPLHEFLNIAKRCFHEEVVVLCVVTDYVE